MLNVTLFETRGPSANLWREAVCRRQRKVVRNERRGPKTGRRLKVATRNSTSSAKEGKQLSCACKRSRGIKKSRESAWEGKDGSSKEQAHPD